MRGTGGALRNALPDLGEAFLVLYGDSYLECDYLAVERTFLESGRLGLMAVLRNEGQWDRSNVLFAGGRIIRYDKRHRTPDMQHIDYGLGALRAGVFDRYPPDGSLDLAVIYRDLLASDQLAAFEVHTRFYEIGSPAGLDETRRHLGGAHVAHDGPAGGRADLEREAQTPVGHRPLAAGVTTEEPSPAWPFARQHLTEAAKIIAALDAIEIERMVTLLTLLRERGGRLFFLGVGGSAANCSHAVNDFRKIAGIDAYTPLDNVSELTARINDEGWDTVFAAWLKGSRLHARDMLFVFSVGGGSVAKNISPNLVKALQYAKDVGAQVVGVVGRDGGYTAQVADACIVVPTVNPESVTPHTEAFQAVIWHLLVSHPALKVAETKWESTR